MQGAYDANHGEGFHPLLSAKPLTYISAYITNKFGRASRSRPKMIELGNIPPRYTPQISPQKIQELASRESGRDVSAFTQADNERIVGELAGMIRESLAKEAGKTRREE